MALGLLQHAPSFYFCFFFFFFLSQTNIFIQQSIDKYKKNKESFKGVQNMVESNPDLEPQEVAPHKNLYMYRRTIIVKHKNPHLYIFPQ